MKKNYNIGISCIGSGVGQSVVNSLKLSNLPVTTIGFGTNPFAFGAYDCDKYDYTRSIYDDGYIEEIIQMCDKHSIDLLIPGLDDEAFLFAKNSHKLESAGVKAIFSEEDLIAICRDKEKMSLQLNKIVDVFVKSYDKNTLSEDINSGKVRFPFIAKPRDGFASRGIEIIRNESDLNKIMDYHIVQELAVPRKSDPNYSYYQKQISKNINPQVSEVSIQLVYSPTGELMGKMASYNKLNNGVPIEVLPYEEEYLWEVMDQLTPELLKLGLKGPINIQGRLTDEGLKLFEMNPRFTGITGLRALMGFNEVEACVKEWLNIDSGKNQLEFNYTRFGMRQTADKAVPIARNAQVQKLSERLGQNPNQYKQKILITGASGYLGRNLINALKENEGYEIWAFGRDKEKLKETLKCSDVKLYDNEDLLNGFIHFGSLDILLHLGFARPHKSNNEIAESLKFTSSLFTQAAMNHVPTIINISSQSVYGQETEPLWSEETPVNPASPYAQAKYATELILSSLYQQNRQLCYTSIRLGTLAGGASGLVETDLLSKLVKQALNGEDLKIYGGQQQIERLDIRDAVNALVALLTSNPQDLKPVYNLGSGQTFNLLELANRVVEETAAHFKTQHAHIKLIEDEVKPLKFGLDSTLFETDFNWKPSYDLNETVKSLISYFEKNKNGVL